MFKTRKIKVAGKDLSAYSIKLLSKNLIVIRGGKGYICCGYLDLSAAEKFSEAAVKITGVSTIKQALETVVFDCSKAAKKIGIHKNQPIKDVIKIIA